MGFLLFILGIMLIALAGPADGPTGTAGAFVGVALVWVGYVLRRRGGVS